jgi:DNA-binding transcriptional MerR regulator
VSDEPRYAIGDLAALGGVSRRTVRYYVQEGLLPAPLGVGRGNHYGPAHLDQLLRVKALQETGHTLEAIRQALNSGEPLPAAASAPPSQDRIAARSVWRRFTLAPGVELHLSSDVGLPTSARLAELSAWCQQNLAGSAAPVSFPGQPDSSEE